MYREIVDKVSLTRSLGSAWEETSQPKDDGPLVLLHYLMLLKHKPNRNMTSEWKVLSLFFFDKNTSYINRIFSKSVFLGKYTRLQSCETNVSKRRQSTVIALAFYRARPYLNKSVKCYLVLFIYTRSTNLYQHAHLLVLVSISVSNTDGKIFFFYSLFFFLHFTEYFSWTDPGTADWHVNLFIPLPDWHLHSVIYTFWKFIQFDHLFTLHGRKHPFLIWANLQQVFFFTTWLLT